MITKERIAELRAVIAKATPGPFATDNYECAPGDLGLDRYGIFQIGEDDPALAYIGPWGEAEANARLFSESANSLPSCLDTIEEQAKRIVELEAALKPFADAMATDDAKVKKMGLLIEPDDCPQYWKFCFGELRAASAALKGE